MTELAGYGQAFLDFAAKHGVSERDHRGGKNVEFYTLQEGFYAGWDAAIAASYLQQLKDF